jgi:hypothetical protein
MPTVKASEEHKTFGLLFSTKNLLGVGHKSLISALSKG